MRIPSVFAFALGAALACAPAPGARDDGRAAHADAAEGEGEGDAAEGEGEGDAGDGEGEGEGEGEGAGEGGRSVDEVCARWRGFADFGGTEWTPLGDGSDTCDVGTLDAGAQGAALARVNLYRWLAGLPEETLAAGLVEQEQACAAVEVGIGHLDHFPAGDAPCYTPAGAAGAGSSNLAMGTGTVGSVDLFVDDGGVASLGHRRWVLNPSGAETAFGHKGAFTCMYSFSSGATFDPDFVTWPPAGPVPVDAARGRFWIGTSHHAFRADTVVEVSVDGGAFAQVPYDLLGYGYGSLATNVAFDVPADAQAGRSVSVRVSGLDDGSAALAWTTRYTACP